MLVEHLAFTSFMTSSWVVLRRDILHGKNAVFTGDIYSEKTKFIACGIHYIYVLVWHLGEISTVQTALYFLLVKRTGISTILYLLLLWFSKGFLNIISSNTGISNLFFIWGCYFLWLPWMARRNYYELCYSCYPCNGKLSPIMIYGPSACFNLEIWIHNHIVHPY